MANNPSLTIRIGADASGAIQNLNQTTNHVRNLGSQVNNTTNHFNHYNTTINQASNATTGLDNRIRGLSGSFGLLNAAISGISFGAAIKEIATFETKMLGLKALTMANSQEMAQMEKQARSLGATTAFSAQEAAQAQSVLASAGLKTNEILTATPKILQLAAAGTLELSKAAEISVAAMHGMGLELKDLGHINDVLVQAASDYTINVEQLGHAFGETAVVAHTYGVSLEATASSLGILKESGMAAGSIGDALKSLFGALVNDTKQNTEVLGRYTTGLDHHKMSYKDLNVETLGYTKVLQNLKDAHIGATDMTKLFGETASTAAILLSEHISKIKDNESAYIKLNGAAERQSDILNQGLSKAWDALKGSLSEAALQLGDSGLKGALTGIIQQATGVISIYEGMGDSFRKSNKLADDQFQNCCCRRGNWNRCFNSSIMGRKSRSSRF
jgi:TP901 family phage tail tape measure protein